MWTTNVSDVGEKNCSTTGNRWMISVYVSIQFLNLVFIWWILEIILTIHSLKE